MISLQDLRCGWDQESTGQPLGCAGQVRKTWPPQNPQNPMLGMVPSTKDSVERGKLEF